MWGKTDEIKSSPAPCSQDFTQVLTNCCSMSCNTAAAEAALWAEAAWAKLCIFFWSCPMMLWKICDITLSKMLSCRQARKQGWNVMSVFDSAEKSPLTAQTYCSQLTQRDGWGSSHSVRKILRLGWNMASEQLLGNYLEQPVPETCRALARSIKARVWSLLAPPGGQFTSFCSSVTPPPRMMPAWICP